MEFDRIYIQGSVGYGRGVYRFHASRGQKEESGGGKSSSRGGAVVVFSSRTLGAVLVVKLSTLTYLPY